MEWRAEAAEQAKRHNYDARTRAVGEQLPTEADAARTAEWAQTIYSAAEGSRPDDRFSPALCRV